VVVKILTQESLHEISLDQYSEGILGGHRGILGRAITLVESRRADHRELAHDLLERLLPHTGKAQRVGVTGVPGVGKSTFLERLGMQLVEKGHKVAVLAIDPSSVVSRGSILGDKTRMNRLATDPRAFVRPSPTGGSLGGVARKTREVMLLCEAAGYDVVFVETVGVGQSESLVAEMVDTVLLLLLPGAGDDLQGIKRGILEMVDLVAVNKADGDSLVAAREARSYYLSALKILRPRSLDWQPPILLCSGLEGAGLAELWEKIEEHREHLLRSGNLESRRRDQRLQWLWSMLEDDLLTAFRRHPLVAEQLLEVEKGVLRGSLHPAAAAARLLAAFQG
jgi:LAO/AO transport system kinase